jgi:hypothetical protein
MAELEFFKEKKSSFKHEPAYAPLKDAFRWCDTILRNDPSDLEAAYIMARTCFNLARFSDPEKIASRDISELYERGFKWISRIEGLDKKFEAAFTLGGDEVNLLDVQYLKFNMRLSLDQPILSSEILQNIYYRFSRTKKDAEYLLSQALLEIKVSDFESAMMTLAEFKTDEHMDFAYKNQALHYLEKLYELKSIYTGEEFKDELKTVTSLKKNKKDFFSSGKFISLDEDPVAKPIKSEILVSALKDFLSARSGKAIQGLKEYLETEPSDFSKIDTLFGLITLVLDRKNKNLNSGLTGQSLFEELARLDKGQEVTIKSLWMINNYIPNPEVVNFLGLNLEYDRLNRLKSLSFELFFPSMAKDVVVRLNANDKGFRISVPDDPFNYTIKADMLIPKIEPGIAVIELYCKDSTDKTAIVPVAFPR